jgi:hypothetical protein
VDKPLSDRRPPDLVMLWWVVVGACLASVGQFLLIAQRPTLASALGVGNPIVGLFVLWAFAVAVQAAAWLIWTTVTRFRGD